MGRSSLFVNRQKTGVFDSLGRVASYESFSLVLFVFGKSYGNWGIWRCGLKQLKGEPNRNGDKSYWKTMNNNGGKDVIDFVRKRCFKPQRERSGVRRKHTITWKVELQPVVFVTRQDIIFWNWPERKEGQEGSKNTSPSKDIFNERIQNTV